MDQELTLVNGPQDTQEQKYTSKQKNQILVSSLIALCIGNMMMLNVAVFLPTYIKDRNENNDWSYGIDTSSDERSELNANDASLIIAIFFIAQILNAPFNAAIKNKLGSKNAILFGFSLLTSTTFGLGLISRCSSPYTFKNVALVLRFFQGQGDVILQFCGYSIITGIFSDQLLKYIGYIEIVVGLGLGLGPMMGALVNPYLQYEGTMFFFGVLNLGAMIFCYIMIPNQLNQAGKHDGIEAVQVNGKQDKDEVKYNSIGWNLLFNNQHSFFALLTCFVGMFNITFFQGFLTVELEKTEEEGGIGLAESASGYMIGMISLFYLVGCLLLPYTCGNSPRKLQFFFAFIGFSWSMIFMGPSRLLSLPEELSVIILGYPLLGICQVFVFIPIIPEMIERLQVDLDISEGENEALDYRLNDQVNEAYTMIYALSSFVSPLLGSFVYTNLGQRDTFDIVAVINIMFSILLFVMNCGSDVMNENKEFLQKLDKVKSRVESNSKNSPQNGKDVYTALN